MLVTSIDNFADAGLYDDFGTLVAREQGYIDGAVLNIGAVLVQDRIQLRVTHCTTNIQL